MKIFIVILVALMLSGCGISLSGKSVNEQIQREVEKTLIAKSKEKIHGEEYLSSLSKWDYDEITRTLVVEDHRLTVEYTGVKKMKIKNSGATYAKLYWEYNGTRTVLHDNWE